MADANIGPRAPLVRTARERIQDLATELQDALVELGMGPIIAVVSTDRRPTLEFVNDPFPLRGVPPSRWRTEG